jgi:D-xylose transport system permease protein
MPRFTSGSACRASWRRSLACWRLLGLQLYILGPTGSINLPYARRWSLRPDSRHAGLAVACAGIGAGIVMIVMGMRTRERRRAANLSSQPFGIGWP